MEDEFSLLLFRYSGTVGLEPTLRALKGFTELEKDGTLFTVGDAGMLSRSSALPIFSNIARAL
jgi:hypothetical protein